MTVSRIDMAALAGPGADPSECFAGGGEMGELMRSTDWARTPLGPVDAWPQSLRTTVSICLGTSFPMMIAWGPSLRMIYNDGYLPVVGRRKHPRALGQPLLECFAEIRDVLDPLFRGVMESGRPFGANDMMFPIVRESHAEETYFLFSYSPIRDESGHVGGVLTTCTETTRRVIGERRLRTLRALAAAAAEATSAKDALARAAGTFEPADIPFALLYAVEGGDRARLVAASGIHSGPACPAVISFDDEAAPWPLGRCGAMRKPEVVERLDDRFGPMPGGPWPEPSTRACVLPIARPGQRHPDAFLVAGISPRCALDDEYRAFLELAAEHLTAAVANARAREEERRRAEALAELDRAKTVFFSNVSHEFRTPLTLMLGPLEDLVAGLHGEVPPAMQEPLDVTHRSALRMLKLVNSLLDFARIEAGRMRAVYRPVDLATLTAEVASSFRSAVERAGLRFRVDCVPLSEEVHVDVEMWEKIVLNLLSNALKYTLEGGIDVAVRMRGDLVELEVTDTGVGVPPEELPNLFRRFHRVQGSRARSHEGSGIGLALVQDLLRLHGGEIRCESEVDRGSRFVATVRTGTAHLPADQVSTSNGERPASPTVARRAFVEEATRWLPAERATSGAEPDGRRQRVLVADDNADMRAYLGRILGEHWEVELAADGRAALESVRSAPPDLVLSDVMMPHLDGFGLLRELRRDPRTARVPFVMLSARAGEESRIEGMEAGADDYLVKPFSARELLARVGAHLSLAAVRQQAERQRDELARTLRYNEMFVGMLGHDLRNPLGAIMTAAQLIRRRSTDERIRAPANRILGSGERMARMIEHLLDFTRVRLGDGLPLDRRPVELDGVLRRAVAEVEAALGGDRRFRLDVRGEAAGHWDADRLFQLFGNLAANAVTHGSDGGLLRVELDGCRGDRVVVDFENQGSIPVDALPELFEPFRGGRNSSAPGDGLGLGLYISKAIVTAHGGELSAASEGDLTRFTVVLPRATAEPAP